MAGHSQFKNIMYRKGAQDAKRAKLFTKLGKEITIAAKINVDPASNPRLRSAIQAARVQNMPRDKIDTAIKRASGVAGGQDYEEIRYEGYGPGGVAVIVEALTDNRNRTAADVRSIFTKKGGNLGETGSVAFQFQRVGMLEYPASAGSEDRVLEAAIEAGAEDCTSDSEQHTVTCAIDDLNLVREGMAARCGDPSTARMVWIASVTTPLDEEKAESLLDLVEALEDHDDVQRVYTNADIPDALLQKLSEA
jgi:YebC/PmpR family DNA-binding regulatory protein